MVSGCETTVCTCNNYSGSNVLKMGRHDTILLLTVITKVLVECIIELQSYVCVIFWWSNQKKAQKVAELYCRSKNIYLWMHTLWSSHIEKNNYILLLITISNIFEYQNGSIFHFSMGFYFWIKLEKYLSEDGGGCLIMAMATDACGVGHFRVEPGIFVSNHVFCVSNRAVLCRTWLFCVERVL